MPKRERAATASKSDKHLLRRRVRLTPADLAAFDADCSKLTLHGRRMNEMQMPAVERAG